MKSMNDNNFRNYMADDPYLKHHAGVYSQNKQKNFCACGLNASGGTDVEKPNPEEDVKTKVVNLRAWSYAKTALTLVGLYVVAMWVYKKYIK